MEVAEECSHALVCVLGCLGLSSQQAKFKLTPTTVYYLSLFWPVVDVAGDTLFLLTELMTVEMTKKLEKGPVPPAALACVAAASILFSLCLILWRFSYMHKMEDVGFDLTPKEDLFEEDDEPGVGKSTRKLSVANPITAERGAAVVLIEMIARRKATAVNAADAAALDWCRARDEPQIATLLRMNKDLQAKVRKLEPDSVDRAKQLRNKKTVEKLVRVERKYATLTFTLEDLLQVSIQVYVVVLTGKFTAVSAFTLLGTGLGAFMIAFRSSKLKATQLWRSRDEPALRAVFAATGAEHNWSETDQLCWLDKTKPLGNWAGVTTIGDGLKAKVVAIDLKGRIKLDSKAKPAVR